jgi:hypothetical protein
MKNVSKNLIAQNRWKQAGVHCFFAVLSAIFLFAHVSGWAHSPLTKQELGSQPAQLSANSFFYNSHPADRSPVGVNPILSEVEVLNEVSPENEFDNDGIDITDAESPTQLKFNLDSGNSLYLQLKLACEDRETISLFVLHHCWKSFLH